MILKPTKHLEDKSGYPRGGRKKKKVFHKTMKTTKHCTIYLDEPEVIDGSGYPKKKKQRRGRTYITNDKLDQIGTWFYPYYTTKGEYWRNL